jgi:hypothetical protein
LRNRSDPYRFINTALQPPLSSKVIPGHQTRSTPAGLNAFVWK